MRLTLNCFDRAPVDWRCFGCGRYVLVQWLLDAKAAFRRAKHGVLGTALALVAAERNLAVELHGSPCSPRTFGVVEVRGVEPLTFSMPCSAVAGTGKDGQDRERLFADFSEPSNLLIINEPHQPLCVHWFCLKPPTAPAAGKSYHIRETSISSEGVQPFKAKTRRTNTRKRKMENHVFDMR